MGPRPRPGVLESPLVPCLGGASRMVWSVLASANFNGVRAAAVVGRVDQTGVGPFGDVVAMGRDGGKAASFSACDPFSQFARSDRPRAARRPKPPSVTCTVSRSGEERNGGVRRREDNKARRSGACRASASIAAGGPGRSALPRSRFSVRLHAARDEEWRHGDEAEREADYFREVLCACHILSLAQSCSPLPRWLLRQNGRSSSSSLHPRAVRPVPRLKCS